MNNPTLPPESPFDAQVRRFHEHRLTWWYTFLIPSISLIIILLGAVQGILWYRMAQASKLQCALETQHKELAQQWSIHQKSAKRLKAITKELSLLQDNKLPSYLTALSETIPAHTLITSLEFQAPHTLKVTGYADTMEELSQFMMNLSSQKDIKVSLNRSYTGAPGIYFEVSTETPQNAKQTKM